MKQCVLNEDFQALVGTDIADLLLSFTSETSHAHIFSPYQASNIESDSVKLSVEEVTNKFRDLLLLGNKKEALGKLRIFKLYSGPYF